MSDLKPVEKSYDVGVIVGRFQVPDLHAAHKKLFDYVLDRHSKVIVLLGVSAFQRTTRNPLDFESRMAMIHSHYSNVICLPIHDNPSDVVWSGQLDVVVKTMTFTQTVILYGARDSFINQYSGVYPTQLLESDSYMSGTAVRDGVRRSTINNASFRAGVIWGVLNQYPRVIPTVDVIVYNEDRTKVLLVRKPNEEKWRFIGGFADPKSVSYEQDATREVSEEVGIEIGDIKYIGSWNVEDWRMAGERDKIRTLIFSAKYTFGAINPQDDIDEAAWFGIKDVADVLMDFHFPIWSFAFNKEKI